MINAWERPVFLTVTVKHVRIDAQVSFFITNKWILDSILSENVMRIELVAVGIVLTIFSIPAYFYSPGYLSSVTHSFISSMSGGNMNTASMLRQMGYPSMHQVISMLQYSLIGMAVAGIGIALYGVVAKKIPKAISVKLVADEPIEELHVGGKSTGSKNASSRPNPRNDPAMFDAVNDVLGKLESELKEMKTGYEDHKQKIENEKKKLEQREREQLAKIIATGEVLIKEITPDQFGDRIKYYVELKNKETGKPVDLSLLAEKFAKMKQSRDFNDGLDITASDFKNMKRFLDE